MLLSEVWTFNTLICTFETFELLKTFERYDNGGSLIQETVKLIAFYD